MLLGKKKRDKSESTQPAPAAPAAPSMPPPNQTRSPQRTPATHTARSGVATGRSGLTTGGRSGVDSGRTAVSTPTMQRELRNVGGTVVKKAKKANGDGKANGGGAASPVDERKEPSRYFRL